MSKRFYASMLGILAQELDDETVTQEIAARFCTDVVIRSAKERDVILLLSKDLNDYDQQMKQHKLLHGIQGSMAWREDREQVRLKIEANVITMLTSLNFENAPISIRRRLVEAYKSKDAQMPLNEALEALKKIPKRVNVKVEIGGSNDQR